MNNSDDDLAEVVELHPSAVSALAQQTAVEQHAQGGLIERLDESVVKLECGETSWQCGIDARLEAQAIALDRIEKMMRVQQTNIDLCVNQLKTVVVILRSLNSLSNVKDKVGI